MEKAATLKEIRAILREAYKLTKQINTKEPELFGPKILNEFGFEFPNDLTQMAFEEFFEENFPESDLVIYTKDKEYKSISYLKDNGIWYDIEKKIYIDEEADKVEIKYKNNKEFMEAFVFILSNNETEEIIEKYGNGEDDLLFYLSHIIMDRYSNILPNKEYKEESDE